MSSEQTFVRDPDLWFDHGDLVLQAGNSLFRVPKETLAATSLVFEGMLDLPQPDEDQNLVDGCPIVPLGDAEQDLRLFLQAIFHPNFLVSATFDDLAAVMKLSDKYEANGLRASAIKCLEDQCPMTLKEFERRRRRFDDACVCALAREYRLDWILPSALFAVFRARKLVEIADGFTANGSFFRLADEDRRALLNATKVLGQEGHTIMIRSIAFPRVSECNTRDKCQKGKMNILRGYSCNPYRPCEGPDPLHGDGSMFRWLAQSSGACGECVKVAEEVFQRERDDFWERLPEIFGLRNWKRLKAMREALMENQAM